MPKGKVSEPESTDELSETTSEGQFLTARQKEILSLVAQGFTNREIGERLDISVRTVEVHRFNLMRRLRVRNVAQLLRQAIALQIIPKGPPVPKV
jgi:DNA-binding NarL/FixJ family response regulator